MVQLWQTIISYAKQLGEMIGVFGILDIVVVAFVFYQLIKLTQQTRASQVIKGFIIIIVVSQICNWLGMVAISWLLDTVVRSGALVLVVLFQPELRQMLERVGRNNFLDTIIPSHSVSDNGNTFIEEICHAVKNMAKTKTGALILIRRKINLREVIESGTVINADVSHHLIENLFFPNTPLHDGAMIVEGNKIIAAGCFLPITSNTELSQTLGTRHRAAIGITEQSDAVAIVVSEENGIISVAEDGKLNRYLDIAGLRRILTDIYSQDGQRGVKGFNTFKKRRADNDNDQEDI